LGYTNKYSARKGRPDFPLELITGETILKILTVEDQGLDQMGLERTLQTMDHGYLVTMTTSLEGALELIDRVKFDFVFSDLHIYRNEKYSTPVTEPLGFEVLSACKQRAIRCAMISAYASAESIDEAKRRGACSFFPKSLSVPLMASIMSLVLKNETFTYCPMVAGPEPKERLLISSLTPVQLKVLELLSDGKTYKQISKLANISENSVKSILGKWYAMSASKNRAEGETEFKRLSANARQ